MGPTGKLAEFVESVRFEDLPMNVVHQAKRLILDTIGNALGCDERGNVVLGLISRLAGRPESTLIGTKQRSPSPLAAFCNAKLASFLDFDETFMNKGHPGTPTTCATLAVGEAVEGCGKDLLTGVATGYDVAVRVGVSAGLTHSGMFGSKEIIPVFGHSWHVFGAVTGACKMLELDWQTIMNAFGLAAHYAPIPLSYVFSKGPEPMVKIIDQGWVANGGVMAALLAQSGYTGYVDVLEGEGGFWRAFNPSAKKCDYSILTAELGHKWYIVEGLAFKPYPCCRWIHHSIDVLTSVIKENNIAPEDIETITIRMTPILSKLFFNYDWRDAQDTQHSIPYNIAIAALGFKPDSDWQSTKRVMDPRVKAMAKRVRIEEEPGAKDVMLSEISKYRGSMKRLPTRVEIVAKGKVFGGYTEYAKGDTWASGMAMTDEELKHKFRVNAIRKLEDSQIEALIETIYTLEKLDDLSDLSELLSL